VDGAWNMATGVFIRFSNIDNFKSSGELLR
jgi:hypothetical protein